MDNGQLGFCKNNCQLSIVNYQLLLIFALVTYLCAIELLAQLV